MQGKVEDQSLPEVHVGIDVSKANLDVHIHPLGERLRVSNDSAGHDRLAESLGRFAVKLVLMEPTSRYHRTIQRRLHEACLPVALVNPLRARLFAEAIGKRAKTDAIDAAMLALMAERVGLEASEPVSRRQEELQELVSARTAALAEQTALRNRLSVTQNAFLKREHSKRLRSISGHIDRIEAIIEALIKADAEMTRKAKILRSIPAIGAVSTQALLAQLHELGRISSKQAAALVGLAPYARDSGGMHGKRSIRGGRAELRSILYMAALVASRRNPDLKRFYDGLVARGKAKKLALIAVARKLVALANTLVAKNREWVPDPA